MAHEITEPWTQLATRIPKELHRRLKLHCVTHEIALQCFVTEAIGKEAREEGEAEEGRLVGTIPRSGRRKNACGCDG